MSGTILVVEDEPAIADTIVYALRTEGFGVASCVTAGEALEAFHAGGIDLIVLDVGLPDQTGFEVCKAIRKTSNVPIIFLTARSGEVDRVVGLEIGGDDYVSKPFSPRELAARVKAVLRRTLPSEETEAGPPISPWTVDRSRRRITYHAQTLDLSRYEYRILEVLLAHPGWVYSREQLMQMVWESPESAMDRTVDTHIKTLRAKLREVDPGVDPIQTHRGVGYSLKELS